MVFFAFSLDGKSRSLKHSLNTAGSSRVKDSMYIYQIKVKTSLMVLTCCLVVGGGLSGGTEFKDGRVSGDRFLTVGDAIYVSNFLHRGGTLSCQIS